MQGRSLIEIARGPDMPSPGVIRSWRRRHVDFYFALQAARRFQLELLAGGLIDAADTARPVGVDRSVIAALLRYGYGE